MERKVVEKKVRVFIMLAVVVFAVLFFRLAELQIFRTEQFAVLARENRLRLMTIRAPRGEIYDRHGQKIVGNRPVYTLSIANLGKPVPPAVIKRLARLLGKDEAELREKMKAQVLPYEPVRVATDVPLSVVTFIEEHQEDFPGVLVDITPVRAYPYGTTLAHVIGYVQEIKPEQLEKYKDEGYKLGDPFGQDGIEYVCERYLRGEDGARYLEVDATGRPVRDLGVKPPVSGANVTLTIDLKLQRVAEEALKRAVEAARREGYPAPGGAAVAEDVRTGEILALASFPAYDPAAFTRDLKPQEVAQLFGAPDKPFLNRALRAYPPGSTFKMVTAMAALESGKITPKFTIYDTGVYVLGRVFHDWLPGGHGRVDLVKAIQVSCDVYFWTIGNLTGINEIARIAREFGLGETTGLGLPGEVAGVVPTPEYKYRTVKAYLDAVFDPRFEAVRKKYAALINQAPDGESRARLERERDRKLAAIQAEYERYAWDLQWRAYDTLNTAIGQGYNLYTPLQLVNYAATIANNGVRYRPYLVKKVVGPGGELIAAFGPEVAGRAKVKPETLKVIQEGMALVTKPGGTAYGAFYDLPVNVAAKTGSAEVSGRKGTHALFIAYAPVEKPEVAVAVVVENAGHGGSVAAPVARDIFAAYFGLPLKMGQEIQKTGAGD
ncbi:peptidoglycan glycosyltransferase [Thermodesulfitimonas autotrophica]|uniref:Peptidoglycan glycosyltransferase n=1 Tax=Thermodesulfitimonas autotrophica TaxID=1894989 RepID=A0A3N5BFL1_9THEO|nr:penicillin-binding protein 2 [Thermodesulfitimonas autotrophica]RPF42841.1 peptidoglycan glycosyltransferase [Thermodesulfitimonas autotrophica]